MKQTELNITKITSIKELHTFMGLPSPLNPLLTIINHSQTQNNKQPSNQKLLLDFTTFQSKEVLKEN